MNHTPIKIVTDSSSDMKTLSGIPFAVTPLKIITSQEEYVDNEALNVAQMVDDLQNYKGKSSTSCPNVGDWLQAFEDAEKIICVTITGTLSGSWNAAMLAKDTYEEQYPDRQVFVLDSLTAGPEMQLILEKARDLALAGVEFSELCKQLKSYTEQTGLLFMLESMKNLANNGRVSPIVAKMAGLLGIRVVGKASDRGDLEPLNKCRGEKKALQTILEHMKEYGLQQGRVVIAHSLNESAAKELKAIIAKQLPDVQTEIHACAGLCSFYAEKGGLLVGFEKY